MAPPNTATVFTRSRDGAGGDAQLHYGHRQQHHNQLTDGCGDNQYQNLWRDTVQRDRQQRNPIGQPSGNYDLHGDRCNAAIFVQQRVINRRHHRNARHHAHHLHHFYHAVAICLLAIAPAVAEEPTTVVAAPQSSSTGSVTNQAVQINQGSYNNQSFGSGLTCSGPTLVFTPFVIGSSVYHEATGNANYGFQMSLSMPLDREAVSLCKAHARQKLSKERLDYELVRVLKCSEFLKSGFVIHQESSVYVLCADVWPSPRSGSISRVSSGSASKAD
jgi:hypothetical protein